MPRRRQDEATTTPFTAAVLAVALIANGAVAAPSAVRTTGDERVVPNAMVQATLRFTPGMIGVTSGDDITWTDDDKSTAPHTATIVAEFPGSTLDEIFGCGRRTVRRGLAAHAGSARWSTPAMTGSTSRATPSCSRRRRLDQRGGDRPAGTTLKYLCAIHPWMQGTITVR